MKYFLKKILKLLTLAVLVWAFYLFVIGNFHQIDKDAYRSAQLFSFNMPYYIKKYKIKSILNLRGKKTTKEWYKNEIRISNQFNISHYDFKLSSKKELTLKQMQDIVKILKKAKKPILIHCEGGADRTSLVSALYLYAVKNKSKSEARKAISFLYGHITFLREEVKAMDISFDKYER